MQKRHSLGAMRETAVGLFMAEPPTPHGQRIKPKEDAMAVSQSGEKKEEKVYFKCDVCQREFTTAQGLGSHKHRAHKIAGTSKRALQKKEQKAAENADAAVFRGHEVTIDGLLVSMFPNGIPANTATVEAVVDFLSAYRKLTENK